MSWRADRIGSALRGINPTVLTELPSGFAVIGDVQFLPGYCVLLGRDPTPTALAEMPRPDRVRFLADVDLLATAVEIACRETDTGFRRINIDVLGNTDSFVHAHVWPRYEWEELHHRARPVWLYDPACWSNPSTALSDRHQPLRSLIATRLRELVDRDTITVHDHRDLTDP